MKRIIHSHIILTLLLGILLISCSSDKKERNYFIKFETSEGLIKIRLYNNTPLHRDNFITLVKDKYYDGIIFHRVINEFMIQTGDHKTKPGMAADTSTVYDYTVPAEIIPGNFHKKGVLAAARTGDRHNPERKSSGTQFYIVHGKKYDDTVSESGDSISGRQKIASVENRINSSLQQNIFYKYLKAERLKSVELKDNRSDNEIQEAATLAAYSDLENYVPFTVPEEHFKIYEKSGGTPHLDKQYTVFGEVVEGLDIVDKIAIVETDQNDKPLKDITIVKARMSRK